MTSPVKQMLHILNDVSVNVLIHDNWADLSWCDVPNMIKIDVNTRPKGSVVAQSNVERLGKTVKLAAGGAYITYTSGPLPFFFLLLLVALAYRDIFYRPFIGSTGLPKGVLSLQKSCCGYIQSMASYMQLDPGFDVSSAASSQAWDTSIHEMYCCLASGCTLVMLNHDEVRMGNDLLHLLEERPKASA